MSDEHMIEQRGETFRHSIDLPGEPAVVISIALLKDGRLSLEGLPGDPIKGRGIMATAREVMEAEYAKAQMERAMRAAVSGIVPGDARALKRLPKGFKG